MKDLRKLAVVVVLFVAASFFSLPKAHATAFNCTFTVNAPTSGTYVGGLSFLHCAQAYSLNIRTTVYYSFTPGGTKSYNNFPQNPAKDSCAPEPTCFDLSVQALMTPNSGCAYFYTRGQWWFTGQSATTKWSGYKYYCY